MYEFVVKWDVFSYFFFPIFSFDKTFQILNVSPYFVFIFKGEKYA